MAAVTSLPLVHLQLYCRVVCKHISRGNSLGHGDTYGIAVVAVAGNVGLATAHVDASVGVGIAPSRTLCGVDLADGERAARNGCGECGVGLGRRKASKSRSGDDESRVEHGEVCGRLRVQ
jgi:predicted RNA-binding Zn-ribbon protein involved in translation (DUF1610 family)